MESREKLANKIVKNSGEILLKQFEGEKKWREKGIKDVVLKIDTDVEDYIVEQINKTFPNDNILTEESGIIGGNNSPYRWIIDPLDGSLNYLYNNPYYCVSIAIQYESETKFSCIYSPSDGRLFSASRGEGSYVNEKKLSVSKEGVIKNFLISYSTSNHGSDGAIDIGEKYFSKILENCRAARLYGSSLLDLCGLASGQFDGLVKIYPKFWDIAAGCLIVEEAGGRVTDRRGEKWREGNKEIIASNNQNHKGFLKIFE